jgi:hypothetical protein
MTAWRRIAAIAAMTVLLAGGARGADDLPTDDSGEPRQPRPREAISAALLNLVFLPVRLPLTVIGAELSGLTGFLTFGGKHAADDVFGFFDGTQVIDEHVIDGREPFCVGRYDSPRCANR